MSTSRRNPTRSRPHRRCWRSSASPPAPWSRSTRCIAKKTFEAAAAANLTLIAQLKDNQPTLHAQAKEIATTTPRDTTRSVSRGRNRFERRTVSVFEPGDTFAGTDWQDHIKTVIRVERDVLTFSAASGACRPATETAIYLANAPLLARVAAAGIRTHWRVETTSHHSRDVTMGEDRSRIRTNPGIFARIRSFAFNILKANQSSTLPQDRYRAALGGLAALLKMLRIR